PMVSRRLLHVFSASRSDVFIRDQEALGRELERQSILRELHDTVKQNIQGTSMMIEACIQAHKAGDTSSVRDLLDGALRMSVEAGHQLSKPMDELRLPCHDRATLTTCLIERIEQFGKDFGMDAYVNLEAPLEMLSQPQIIVVHRVCIEASWNAAKHSAAGNLWLKSRLVRRAFVLELVDDGRGFDVDEPTDGLGLRFVRSRAAEVGAVLNVITAPGRGTTVQLKFGIRGRHE
ncbi:MAG: histidine kinase, partial [Actinobacteria bacterium]|nr:histidine kinase [Actinomycetota bacterium]